MQTNQGNTMSTAPDEYLSIGLVCATLGHVPRAIRRAAEDLGIQPTIINALHHYTSAQVEHLAQHFRDNPPPPYKSKDKTFNRRRLER